MSNVIEFKRPEKEEPHGSGEAFCLGCGEEWIQTAPVGNTQFECPACHAMKGLWRFPFAPSEGQMVRQCNCGNQLFYLTPDGHMCANCGTYQTY